MPANDPIGLLADLICSLDSHFEDFEFIHYNLSAGRPKKIRLQPAEVPDILRKALFECGPSVSDSFPYFRKTYIEDFTESIIEQYRIFVLREPIENFQATIEKIYGFGLPGKYDLESEVSRVQTELSAAGWGSILKFEERDKTEEIFPDQRKLRVRIDEIIRSLTAKTAQVKSIHHPHCTDEAIFSHSSVSWEATRDQNIPCFYYYRGNYRGRVGLQYKKTYSTNYLNKFIMHECMPGHHFYYATKQALIDAAQVDAIFGIDTFYSPENLINEGLAVSTDLIKELDIDIQLRLSMTTERLFHKIMYNAWYDRQIVSNETRCEIYKELISECFGMSKPEIDRSYEYFTMAERFYTPCYGVGGKLVEDFTQNGGSTAWAYLYGQNSARTLEKIRRNLTNEC